MDPEIFIQAKENGLSPEDAEAIANIVDETGLSFQEAMKVWIG